MVKLIQILIIEDEEAIRDMLRFALPANEFSIQDAEAVDQARSCLEVMQPDLIILDWMLPGTSGIDFIKWIKQQEAYLHIPIIMLTARAEESHKVRGLLTGADDYITKPFSPNELYARIKALLRRRVIATADNIVRHRELSINPEMGQIAIEQEVLNLTPIEYKLLFFLVTHPNKIYSRDQLLNYVWGANVYIERRTVDVQVRRLRDKLKPYNYHQRIKTIRGLGYLYDWGEYEKD